MAKLCERDDAAAQHAIAVFTYRVRKYIGAYAAALGGLDAIAIAGGIGEHCPTVRADILDDFEWLGLRVDRRANGKALGRAKKISTPQSQVSVWVMPVDEAIEMAFTAIPLL